MHHDEAPRKEKISIKDSVKQKRTLGTVPVNSVENCPIFAAVSWVTALALNKLFFEQSLRDVQ